MDEEKKSGENFQTFSKFMGMLLIFSAITLSTQISKGDTEKITQNGTTDEISKDNAAETVNDTMESSSAEIVIETAETSNDKIPQDSATDEINKSRIDEFISGRLSIGTRTVYRMLTEDDSEHRGWYGSGTYLGTIYGLAEDQNYLPFYLYMSYLVNKYFQIELAYDYVEAETRAKGLYSGQSYYDIANGRDKTDGNVILSGPTISIIGRYPNKTQFTPFAGIGTGYFFGSFDADDEWTNRPSGATNIMDIDDAVPFFVTAGTEWAFSEHWSLNLAVQYIKVAADAAFNQYYEGETTQPTQTGEFPLDNVNFRLGVTYQF